MTMYLITFKQTSISNEPINVESYLQKIQMDNDILHQIHVSSQSDDTFMKC